MSRIRLDDLTSADLDQLYDRAEKAEAERAVLSGLHLTALGNLGVTTHQLDQIRDAARLHRQSLISTNELHAVIQAIDEPPTTKEHP
ncbi:hypothetical protein [Streptomyces sp. NPDC002540]